MKITVRFIDGKEYVGKYPSEVVEKMRSSSPFTAKETTSEYMKGYAKRSFLLHRRIVLTVSPLIFLLSLTGAPEIDTISLEIGG